MHRKNYVYLRPSVYQAAILKMIIATLGKVPVLNDMASTYVTSRLVFIMTMLLMAAKQTSPRSWQRACSDFASRPDSEANSYKSQPLRVTSRMNHIDTRPLLRPLSEARNRNSKMAVNIAATYMALP